MLCPVCGLEDQVCSVGTAISSGTSTTNIDGMTFSWFKPEDFSTSSFTSTSYSPLAYAFAPPRQPGTISVLARSWSIVIPLLTIFFLVKDWGATLGGMSDLVTMLGMGILATVISLFIAIFYGIFIGLAIYALVYLAVIPARIRWASRFRKMIQSGYCFRDNVAFDGKQALPPQQFVNYVFS